MTKARDIANLVDANGDIVSSALDNVPPSNDASALTTGTIDNARISLDANEIPNLDTAKITSGTFDIGRIPDLAASKITSGTLAVARGGTGVASLGTANQILAVNSGATALEFQDAAGGAEAGSVIIMPVSTVPTGYLECDGSAISRTTYSALFTILSTTYGSGDGSTTFNIPDLRGEFIRGWDNGRGQDSGRSIGTSQSDAFQGHHHSYRYYNQFLAGGGSRTDDMPQSPNSTSNNRVTTPISDGSNGTPRTANETRPKNIAMMYCIKY